MSQAVTRITRNYEGSPSRILLDFDLDLDSSRICIRICIRF